MRALPPRGADPARRAAAPRPARPPVPRDRRLLDYALGDHAENRFYWTGHDPVALAPNLRWTRLYVSAGDGIAQPGEAPNAAAALGEQNIRRLSERFLPAARRAGVRVRFRPQPGIHNHELAWRSFADAFPWIASRFGEPVPERPRRWTYRTVVRKSAAFGFRFTFAEPLLRVATFRRRGDALLGREAGRVSVRVPGGATQRERLPFRLRLNRPG